MNFIANKKEKSKDNKKFIGILVTEPVKIKWREFAENNKFSTISKLIRKAVNFYIDSQSKISYIEDISKFSHDLKEPLTSIKGFSQIIIENFSNKLDLNVLLRIKEIFDQSSYLENKINEILNEEEQNVSSYDILIIEDDIPTNTVLADFFKLKGYKCKSVTSGTKGLEELNKSTPRLILLDIVLPDIDGFEICKTIKNDKRFKTIPVFYVTAIPESKVKDNMAETGADGFLLKPFNFDDFEVLFNSYL